MPPMPQLPPWLVYIIIFVGFFIAFFYLILLFLKREPVFTTKKDFSPDVTFIIPAKNVQTTLEKCVKRVVEQDYPGKIIILIINDASTDNTKKIAENLIKKYSSEKRKILLLNRKKSTGFKSSVLNFGLKYLFSKGKITYLVAHLDADTFIPKNLLKEAVPYFNDKRVMAVTSWMMPSNEKGFLVRMQKIEYMMASFYRYLLSRIGALCIAPAFTIFKSEFFRKAGYYDETTLTEDFEIALRIKSYGYSIVYLDKKITTVLPETFNKLRKERIRWWHGTFQNLCKYKHLISPRYGALGTFFLPVTILLGTFTLLLVFVIVAYGIAYNVTNFVRDLLLGVIPRLEFELETFKLVLALSDPRLILGIFAFIISILFFIFAIKKGKEKIRIIDYLLFVFVYSWILIIFCVEGTIKYLFKAKVSW